MTWLQRLRHRADNRPIEQRLAEGEAITVRLAPELLIHVGLDGLTMAVTSTQPMPDEQGRQLLLAARYAVTCPPGPHDHQEAPEEPEEDDGGRNIRVSLSPAENNHLGDVLAAYFRLTEE